MKAQIEWPPGSAFSMRLVKTPPGKWVYRNFRLTQISREIVIGNKGSDQWGVKSLAAARRLIDQWYAEGSVEM